MKKINLTDYIRKAGETVRLTETERTRMKHVLAEYMSVKPIRQALVDRRKPITTAWIQVYAFSRKSVAWALLFALLFSGAGVSYAAEGTVPGDVLYPLKVGVSEPLQGALSVSAESRASWNATLAERRLEEAEKLASENKLTEEKKTELIARFDQHADLATEGIQKLETAGSPAAIGIASDFEATLAAHVTVLGDVDGEGKFDAVKTRVREKALALSVVRTKAEEDAFVSAPASAPIAVATTFALQAPAQPLVAESRIAVTAETGSEKRSDETHVVRKEVVEKMSASAKGALQNVQKLFTRLEKKLNDASLAEIKAQISDEVSLINTGDVSFAGGDYAAAFRSYQEASVGAGKLAVYLKTLAKLKINVIPYTSRATTIPLPSVPEPLHTQDEKVLENATPSNVPLLPSIQILPPQTDDSEQTHSEDSTNDGPSIDGELRLRDRLESQLKTKLGL